MIDENTHPPSRRYYTSCLHFQIDKVLLVYSCLKTRNNITMYFTGYHTIFNIVVLTHLVWQVMCFIIIWVNKQRKCWSSRCYFKQFIIYLHTFTYRPTNLHTCLVYRLTHRPFMLMKKWISLQKNCYCISTINHAINDMS